MLRGKRGSHHNLEAQGVWRRVGVWRLRGRLAPPGSSGPRLRWGRAPFPPRAGSALPSLAASGRHRARRARGPAPWAALVRIRYVLPHPRGLCAVWSPPFVSKISPPRSLCTQIHYGLPRAALDPFKIRNLRNLGLHCRVSQRLIRPTVRQSTRRDTNSLSSRRGL